MTMTLHVGLASLDDPDVVELVVAHHTHCMAESPPESVHALQLDALRAPAITLWGAWHDGTLAGIGALRALPGAAGEIKTMHTRAAKRGLGVGAAILAAIVAEAERRGYRALYLETGSYPVFAPARALYEHRGFTECPPFADYRPDPHSAFFTMPLEGAPAP